MDAYGITLDGYGNVELFQSNALMGGFFSFGSWFCYSLLIVECDHHFYLKNVKTNHDLDVPFFRKVLAHGDNVMLNFVRVILARHDPRLISKYYFTENLW